MTYEELIYARAERHGYEVLPENGGLAVLDDEGGEAWHRLGGVAEEMFNDRVAEGSEPMAEGRWAAVLGNNEPPMRWVPGLR